MKINQWMLLFIELKQGIGQEAYKRIEKII